MLPVHICALMKMTPMSAVCVYGGTGRQPLQRSPAGRCRLPIRMLGRSQVDRYSPSYTTVDDSSLQPDSCQKSVLAWCGVGDLLTFFYVHSTNRVNGGSTINVLLVLIITSASGAEFVHIRLQTTLILAAPTRVTHPSFLYY